MVTLYARPGSVVQLLDEVGGPTPLGVPHLCQAVAVVSKLAKCQEPAQLLAAAGELVAVNVQVGGGGGQLAVGGHGQGGKGEHWL